MRLNYKILLIALVFSLVDFKALSQFNLTTYQLSETLPQANEVNPAFIPNAKFVLGLPAISNIYTSETIPLSLNSFVDQRPDDSLQIDIDQFINKLNKNNDFSIEAQAALLYTGFKIKKNYFSISARALNEVNLTFPKELFELAAYGNGTESILGKDVDISSLKAKGQSLISTSINFARPFVKDRLTLGVRISYIRGFFSVETEPGSEIHLITDPEDYSVKISAENLRANVTGIDFFSGEDENDSPVDYLLNARNTGMGIDIGADYTFSDRLKFSAAISDMGFINWKTDVTNFVVNDSSYTYSGFDILEAEDFFEGLPDSLDAVFDPDETNNSYTTGLSTKFYAGVHYRPDDVQRLGAVFQSHFFRKRIRPALSLSYGVKVNRFLNARVSYSIIQDNPFNLGFGMTLNAGFLQFYAVSDNVYGFFCPQNATYTNVRFGLNLTFGRAKNNW